jgi:hypothetical protein
MLQVGYIVLCEQDYVLFSASWQGYMFVLIEEMWIYSLSRFLVVPFFTPFPSILKVNIT